MKRFDPTDIGWPLGRAAQPATGQQLWVPWDRTCGVIGAQGSGKTLDLLVPALLAAPGAALMTTTKPSDVTLTIGARAARERPVVVLDPFNLAPGLPELIWDPIDGCEDTMVAERRAAAFVAGTLSGRHNDSAAAFYAAQATLVVQSYLHAAAIGGHTLRDLMGWIASPRSATKPEEILSNDPRASSYWADVLHGALHGDDRTVGNTITTVQQTMKLFQQETILNRCTPSPGRPATNIESVIAAGGTIYLLGREDPYASATPLMTALAEYILDTALALAHRSPHGRLTPPMLACLDELPSTAPLPTLLTRMANERALGLSFIWAAQTPRQLEMVYGHDQAKALFGLSNVLAIFGGGKDHSFNQEISDLMGSTRIARRNPYGDKVRHQADEIAIITASEIRQLPERHALVVAENGKPIIAKLNRAIDGKAGQQLLAAQKAARPASPVEVEPTLVDVATSRRGLGGWHT